MKFKDELIKNIIDPNDSSKLSNAIGQVVSYSSEYNKASVFVKGTNGKENYNLKNVPIQLSGIGMHSSSLEEGDMVYIQFNNNSFFQPKIVGFADEKYSLNTKRKEKHTRKGALISSVKEIKGDIAPSSERWIDVSNKNDKYLSFRYSNPIEDISKSISEKGYFNNKEVGLYNPISSSIIKVKDDGIIDIFTSTNVGVRINPLSRTIEMFGDVSTKSNNWSVLSNTIEVTSMEKIIIKAKEIDVVSNKITINGEEIYG